MNYYFLLEDEKSFLKVLPHWLKFLGFQCTRVPDITLMEENNYVLQSGQGVTQLVTKVLFDTIDTICASPKRVDKLIVIIDAEAKTVEQRKREVEQKISEKYNGEKLSFDVIVIVCNRCFETWLLGKPGLCPKTVSEDSFFYNYFRHYDVSQDDPELMPVPERLEETVARYHFHYFHELMRYNGLRYTKKRPDSVATKDYFEGMRWRCTHTDHIPSFRSFIEFIETLIPSNSDTNPSG